MHVKLGEPEKKKFKRIYLNAHIKYFNFWELMVVFNPLLCNAVKSSDTL